MTRKSSKQNQNKLNVVYTPIEELNPAPYNPRKWSDKQRSDLKQSIKRFGLVDPIIVNKAPKPRIQAGS